MEASRDSADSYMRWQRAVEGDRMALQVVLTVQPFASKPPSEWHVLDVGSGAGHMAAGLARQGATVLGVEPSPTLVEQARSQYQHPNLLFERRGIEELDEHSRFDVVVLDNVLEHLPEQTRALRIIERVLRPGGVAYVVVPNRLWPIEHHYELPFLGWLPIRAANVYLRWSGRGTDYTDASYAPTIWRLRRLWTATPDIEWRLVPPADPSLTRAGGRRLYTYGVAALRRMPFLWTISKAFLAVGVKRGEAKT